MATIIPVKNSCQKEDKPIKIRLLFNKVIMATPKRVPMIVPDPPVIRVPPNTTGAITLSSLPTQ